MVTWGSLGVTWVSLGCRLGCTWDHREGWKAEAMDFPWFFNGFVGFGLDFNGFDGFFTDTACFQCCLMVSHRPSPFFPLLLFNSRGAFMGGFLFFIFHIFFSFLLINS